MAAWRAAAVLIGLLVAHAADAAPARRIVSINLCADVLVLSLAPRAAIASLSYLAADPAVSPVAGLAAGIPTNRAGAEEVLAFAPDLVVAAEYSANATRALLARLGIPVVVVHMVDDLGGVRAEMVRLAGALGVPERGEALAATMAARLARLPEVAAVPPTAALLGPGGWQTGALAAAVLAAAGFRPYAPAGGRASMERLVADPPDALVINDSYGETASLANQSLGHPALALAVPARRRIAIPAPLWICPGPALAEAAERLARFRSTIQGGTE